MQPNKEMLKKFQEAKKSRDELKAKYELLQSELFEKVNKIPIENRCPLCGGLGGRLLENCYMKPCANIECRNGFVDIQKPPERIIYKCSECGENSLGEAICRKCNLKLQQ